MKQDNLVSQSFSSLNDWLFYLERIHTTAIDMGLARVTDVARRLGLTSLAPAKVVLVAGTNGKGTTIRSMEQLLLAQGLRVGTYNSPHIQRYNERVRINGQQLADEAHMAAFAAIEQARAEISLTYFEFGTLAALYLLKRAALDVVLLEVGLGGRLDATNIVDTDLSVITTIDLDHKEWLGDTRELVAKEKAGIFREAGLAVIGELQPPVTLAEAVTERHVTARWVNQDYRYEIAEHSWQYQSAELNLSDLPLPQVPVQNVATAMTALNMLQLLPSDATIRAVLAQLCCEGRMQQLSESPRIYVDVAHNPESARYLAGQLAKWLGQGWTVRAVVGMLADKDIRNALAPVLPVVQHWHLASLAGPRGAEASLLAETLTALGQSQYQLADSVAEAMTQARQQLHEQQLIIVFGSFYTVAGALDYWSSRAQ